MKFLLDFFPVLAFFISFKLYDVYVATAVLILASFIQTLGHWIIKKRFEKLHLFTFFASLIMGSLTLFFRDDSFIKWKVSVIYWVLSAVIIVYFLFRRKIAIKDLFEGLFKQSLGISDAIWHKLNAAWILYLVGIGILNIWIAYQFDLDTWVNFKVWGIMAIQLAMMIATFVIIFKYMPEENRQALDKQQNKSED